MEIITALAVAALAAIFISLPFFTRSEDAATGLPGGGYASDPRLERLNALASRKDALLTAVKDIEFDYGLGKLSREDFEELSTQYRMEAAEVLREMDSVGKQDSKISVPDEIEREIMSKRKKGLAVYEDEDIEKEILRVREAAWHDERGAHTCPECGNPHGGEDVFCSKCGTKLNGDSENTHAKSL